MGAPLRPAQPVERLLQDPVRLGHLLQPDPVAIVDVAVLADRDVEVVGLVVEVRPVLPDVVVHAAGPEHRTRERVVDRLLGGERADTLGPPDPDGVAGEHRVHFLQRLREGAGELPQAGFPAVRDVGHQPADPGQAGGEPGAGPGLLQVVDPLPLLERPEERREGPEIDAGGAEPDQVGDDPAHLAGDDPQHLAALGELEAHQLLDRQRQADVVGHGRQVVGAVGERDDLIVVPVLAQLLEPGVQVADVGDTALDGLALELEHQPEHAVGGRVLRARC